VAPRSRFFKVEAHLVRHETLTLNNLAEGAAEELFQHELSRVLENILDPNTEPEAKRQITLKVTFAPKEGKDGERETSDVSLEVSSKLAAIRGVGSGLYLGRRSGKAVAVEATAKQVKMEWEEESKPTPLRGEEETH
jgi:hypothetical protein